MARLFTSDQHLGHGNILKHQADTRPYASLHDMNVALTDYWNGMVGDDDTVHHLGDVSLGNISSAVTYISRLKGKIKITPGNHDYWIKDYRKQNLEILSASGHPIEIMPLYHTIRINGITVTLNHFPMRSWPASYHGSWHLYGHVHKVMEAWGLSMNVGVDQNEGRPFTEAEVVAHMEGRIAYYAELNESARYP